MRRSPRALFAVGVVTAPSMVLEGTVRPTSGAVAGTDLEQAVTQAYEDDGSSVDTMSCPESSAVGQGLVAVCHGSVDGFDSTSIVVFEDSQGSFIVDPL